MYALVCMQGFKSKSECILAFIIILLSQNSY
jgi:hypothetical protein